MQIIDENKLNVSNENILLMKIWWEKKQQCRIWTVHELYNLESKIIVSDYPIIVENVCDCDSGAKAEQYMKHIFVGNFINEISMPEKNI